MRVAGQIVSTVAFVLGCSLVAISGAVAKPGDPVAAASTDAAYRINPGDELEVYVWGEERLQRSVKVLPDGTFAFPLVGQLSAQGKLPQELEQIIGDRLKDQYRGQVPQVTVSVKNPAGLEFSVLGRVKSPGTFSPGRYITVLDALSLAGGPAEFANLDSILLIRKTGGKVTSTRLKLSPFFKSGTSTQDIDLTAVPRLETGDTVVVP